MTANVRCAGGGQWWPKESLYVFATPCGWTAFRTGYVTGYDLKNREWMHGEPTMVPCPRCGGRVELIAEPVP